MGEPRHGKPQLSVEHVELLPLPIVVYQRFPLSMLLASTHKEAEQRPRACHDHLWAPIAIGQMRSMVLSASKPRAG